MREIKLDSPRFKILNIPIHEDTDLVSDHVKDGWQIMQITQGRNEFHYHMKRFKIMTPVKNPFLKESFNLSEQCFLYRSDPELYSAMKEDAWDQSTFFYRGIERDSKGPILDDDENDKQVMFSRTNWRRKRIIERINKCIVDIAKVSDLYPHRLVFSFDSSPGTVSRRFYDVEWGDSEKNKYEATDGDEVREID